MEKLIEALKTIKGECEKYEDCYKCPLYIFDEADEHGFCGVISTAPGDWKLAKVDPVPRLFKH